MSHSNLKQGGKIQKRRQGCLYCFKSFLISILSTLFGGPLNKELVLTSKHRFKQYLFPDFQNSKRGL